MNTIFDILTVRMDYDRKALVIIDQTQLPGKEVYLELRSPEEIWEAVYCLKVRGAPAIGIAVAYGLALCAERIQGEDFGAFFQQFTLLKNYLAGSPSDSCKFICRFGEAGKMCVDLSTRALGENKTAALERGRGYSGRRCRCLPAYRRMGAEFVTAGDGTPHPL